MHNFNISICYKSSFFWSTNYKSNIFHFASFSPLCLPVVSPRFWVEVLEPAFPLHEYILPLFGTLHTPGIILCFDVLS